MIAFRWAEGHYDRLLTLATQLVSAGVAVTFTAAFPATVAAKQVTSTIPIVFVIGADAVKLGLVASLNRPGGYLTGICQLFGTLGAKRLEIIREVVPSLRMLAVLSNPKNPNADDHFHDIQVAARSIGQPIDVFHASSEREIDAAFANLAQRRNSALLLADDPLFNVRRDQIVTLAARHVVPAIYYARAFALAGGLMSYGPSLPDSYRLAGIYVGRILKGVGDAVGISKEWVRQIVVREV